MQYEYQEFVNPRQAAKKERPQGRRARATSKLERKEGKKPPRLM